MLQKIIKAFSAIVEYTMLICRPYSKNRNSLIDHFTISIQFFPNDSITNLLKILGKQLKPVLYGKITMFLVPLSLPDSTMP